MKSKTWIIKQLQANNMNKKAVVDLYESYCSEFGKIKEDSYRRAVSHYYEIVEGVQEAEEFDAESVLRLEASKQKISDTNNQLRKTSREQYRIYNSLEDIFSEYVAILKDVDLTKFKIKEHKEVNTEKNMIVQLSDLHFNEIIESEEANGNTYDFTIASKRLKKFISKAIKVGKFEKITNVHLFLSADFINSSRRLSERNCMATSLTNATVLATFILEQIIVELSKYFNVKVSAVSGNESRLNEFFESGTAQMSENFDHAIFENLRRLFSKTPVKFNDDRNLSQQVIKISDEFNALLLHGNNIKSSTSADKDIAKILQNYAYKGIRINGIFYGHFHNSSIGDFVSRSSSLCGANAYSTQDLGFVSRASQNIYIVEKDGYSAMKIDLQNTDGIEGYEIKSELERYNVRSSRVNNLVTIQNLV